MATVRYLVGDVERAVGFYVGQLGFSVVRQFGAAMAIVESGDLRLWLAGPHSSAARVTPDGRTPEPGGWSRIVLETADLEEMVGRLRATGTTFRNDIVDGPGGRQILIEDPSGNPVELFEPA